MPRLKTDKTYRFSFSWAEVLELRRALDLIIQEDESCDVNCDAASRKAKSSALAKLTKLTGESGMARALKTATSVLVTDVGKGTPHD